MRTAYLDASVIIYLVEGLAGARELVERRIAGVEADPEGRIITSRLSRLECRVKPLRDANASLLSLYDGFFSRDRLVIVDVTASVLERATELRAQHGLKTADAIHVASAIEAGSDLLLTGDAAMARCPSVPVEIVAPT